MAGETTVTLIGNAVTDVDLKYTPQGQAVASFRLASTPRFFDKTTNAWKDGEALFLTCKVWREMAESVAESVVKGMRLIVVGRLAMRSYEKDGEKRTVFEVEADEVGPSLKFATARVAKMARSSGASSGGRASTEDPWASPRAQTVGADGRPLDDSEPPF